MIHKGFVIAALAFLNLADATTGRHLPKMDPALLALPTKEW